MSAAIAIDPGQAAWQARLATVKKCLSVRQPYAGRIANGSKPIEYRCWNTRYRGGLLIVSGQKWAQGEEHDGERGVTIAVVDLVDVECYGEKDFGWVLAQAAPVRPVKLMPEFKAQLPGTLLGLFTPPQALLARLEPARPEQQ